MTRALCAVAVVCAFALSVATANAKPRHHKQHQVARADSQTCAQPVFDNDGHKICREAIQAPAGQRRVTARYADATVIGGRPAGCPRQYCGCGAARYLGLNDPRLNLAWNWTKYYHGPTPVAVWRHHIAIIERMTGPNTAILRDYNSGRGLSRIHERSLAGARIVGRTSYAAMP